MSAEENKAIIRRAIAAFNAQDVAAIDELGTPETAQAARQTIHWVNATFEGHQIEITDMLAEGDQVWVRVTTRGGHSGEFEGLAPTGKQWTNTGVLFYRLANGRITSLETLFDVYGHLKQLGATMAAPVPTT